MTRRRKASAEPPEEERGLVRHVTASDGARGVDTATVYFGGTVTGATGPAGPTGPLLEYGGTPGAPVGGSVSVSSVTARLSVPSTVAMETHLARLPLGVPSSVSSVQLSLRLWSGTLYGRPVRILSALGPMTVTDYRLLAHVIQRYAVSGYPEDRRVPFTLSEAARWSGYSSRGGRQVRLVRTAFLRMRATALEHTARFPDGHTEALTWGPLDEAWSTDEVGREGGFVTISPRLAQFVQVGSLVYLHAPTLDALADLDEYAARLWIALEAEDLYAEGPGWRRYLYSAPEGEPERERDLPAIADLLHLAAWSRRRKAASRVREAALVIERVDPGYRLTLRPAADRRQRGQWTLYAWRDESRRLQAGTPRGHTTLEAGTAGGAVGVLRGAEAGTAGGAVGYSQGRGPVQNRGVPSSLPSSLPSGSSRARGRAREETRDTSRTNGDAVADALAEGRPDVAALLERTGWTRLTPRVRRDLDELADRHDLTGYAWAADRIREAPEDPDPRGRGYMAHVYAAERVYKAERIAAADAEDRALREREDAARRRAATPDDWTPEEAVPDAVREAVAALPRPATPLPPPEPEETSETPEERRARRIAAARAVLAVTPLGYAADKARATLAEYGEAEG